MARPTNLAQFQVTRMKADATKRRKPEQQQARYPMPVGGLNFADSTMSMPPTDCYLCDNFFPRPYGLEIRKGWKYWIPQADAFAGEVRTIMTYNTQNPDFSKVYAAPAVGTGEVYDVTLENTTPTLAFTPSTPSDTAGEWFYTEVVTTGGAFLCVVSQGAGYYIASTDSLGVTTWAEVAEGTNPGEISFPSGDTTTVKDLCFIWTWQNRVWFLAKNSAVAYYLPVGQITGVLAAFDFGPQLIHGGALQFGTRWTYDSGRGMDDSLVLVSTEGDCLIYEGTDPDSAENFKMKGVWYLGRNPTGRRNFTQHGGDLLVLNEYGLLKISDMVAGRLHAGDLSGTIGYKMNPRLARMVTTSIADKYWFLLPLPSEEMLIIATPYINETTGIRQSFLINSITSAWGTFSNMDVLDADVYKGKMISGTRDGNVILSFSGYSDGVPSDNSDVGTAVTGNIQGAFLDYGNANMNKRMMRAKVYGLADNEPSVFCTFKSEYALSELLNAPAPVVSTLPTWDNALWDDAIWNASNGSFRRWYGVSAFGKKMSFQLAARGSSRTVLTDFEVLFETGIGM